MVRLKSTYSAFGCRKFFTILFIVIVIVFTHFQTFIYGIALENKAKTGSLAVGKYVQFGTYNGKPVQWLVINNDANGSVLFAKEILTYKAFDAKGDKADGRDSKYNTRVQEGSSYWVRSNLREWLNSASQTVSYSHQKPDSAHTLGFGTEDLSYDEEKGFLTGFTDAQLTAIQPVKHKVMLSIFDIAVKDGGSKLWIPGGDNADAYYKWVTDKVFLLSHEELNKWVSGNGLPTGAPWYTFKDRSQHNGYWLRSPDGQYAAGVFYVAGNMISGNMNAYRAMGVRPAVYVKPGLEVSGNGTTDDPYIINTGNSGRNISNVNSNGPSSWAVAEIESAKRYNLVENALLGSYQSEITREEFSSLAVRLYEALSSRKALHDLVSPFSDTRNTDVLKAYNLGIIQGVGVGKFAPSNHVTREQVAVMFYRTLEAAKNARPDIKLSSTHTLSFSDTDKISGWAMDAMKFMNENKIILGSGDEINPGGTTTKEQAIVLTNRIFEKFEK